MSKKESGNILSVIAKAIYPEVVKLDTEGLVKEKFEDMECVFYVNAGPTDKLYLKPKMKEILEESGYEVHKTAFENWGRDLKMVMNNVLHRGENGDTELTLISGTLNIGAALFCRELLEEIRTAYGDDYVVLGVLEDGIILARADKDTEAEIFGKLHNEILAEMKAVFLSENIFLYRERQLRKLEEV